MAVLNGTRGTYIGGVGEIPPNLRGVVALGVAPLGVAFTPLLPNSLNIVVIDLKTSASDSPGGVTFVFDSTSGRRASVVNAPDLSTDPSTSGVVMANEGDLIDGA